ncbi:hypothetical protein AO385_0397 [Moraxella catarrhalis]|uniref:Uncharacterized protein n=1 Tax=Moraxella catarrhalis TaxID=480 RepID=A0A198UJS9_MORCA|nr:hypothetical protein AO383_1518 [Moraxella catarrhalis]OAU96651.1 hypothetical protein AO384_0812 [Moraxella catarrhalis]OAV03794.1 hypothetical protein AO385_0397 [Moraxella catarrhalis]
MAVIGVVNPKWVSFDLMASWASGVLADVFKLKGKLNTKANT